MTQRVDHIGFSQRIRLDWLELTANLVLAGNDESVVYSSLQEFLKDKLSVGSNARRGNRAKTISILMRIWVRPPRILRPLHRDGLNLLSRLPAEEHLAAHWGMTMAAYPFWGAVATQVGRLLRLQGAVRHAQVRRRIMEQYGQRPTVKDAVRRVLRSMIDWGVLDERRDSHSRGAYVHGRSLSITDVRLIAWLVEAFLHAQPNGSGSLELILNAPVFFPFRIDPISAAQLASGSERLEVLRHSLDQDLILLRPTTGK